MFFRNRGNLWEIWGKLRNVVSTTKSGHKKFWRMKPDIFWEKVKLEKCSMESEQFSETGGNLKQGRIHSY